MLLGTIVSGISFFICLSVASLLVYKNSPTNIYKSTLGRAWWLTWLSIQILDLSSSLDLRIVSLSPALGMKPTGCKAWEKLCGVEGEGGK